MIGVARNFTAASRNETYEQVEIELRWAFNGTLCQMNEQFGGDIGMLQVRKDLNDASDDKPKRMYTIAWDLNTFHLNIIFISHLNLSPEKKIKLLSRKRNFAVDDSIEKKFR